MVPNSWSCAVTVLLYNADNATGAIKVRPSTPKLCRKRNIFDPMSGNLVRAFSCNSPSRYHVGYQKTFKFGDAFRLVIICFQLVIILGGTSAPWAICDGCKCIALQAWRIHVTAWHLHMSTSTPSMSTTWANAENEFLEPAGRHFYAPWCIANSILNWELQFKPFTLHWSSKRDCCKKAPIGSTFWKDNIVNNF